MPIPPSPPLDETISVGDMDHIATHEAIADALNNDTASLTSDQTISGLTTFPRSKIIDGGSQVIDPRIYGATGDGSTDDSAAFVALAADLQDGDTISPHLGAVYKLDQLLVSGLDDITVLGNGATFLSNSGAKSPIKFTGCARPKVIGARVRRTTVIARNATNYGIEMDSCTDITVERNTVDSVAAAGIFISGCSDGTVTGNFVTGTLADGIHLTNQSKRITVKGNHTLNTGDDGIAVVSYQADGGLCRDISVVGNTVDGTPARGISVIGGQDIEIGLNTVRNTVARAIFLNYDTTYNTYGVNDVSVVNNFVDGTTINSAFGAIAAESGDAAFPVCRIKIAGNIVRNPPGRGIAVGANTAGTSQITIDNNMVTGSVNTIDAGAILAIHTIDVTIRGNFVYGVSAQGITVTSTVTGTVIVTDNTVAEGNLVGVASNDAFLIQAAATAGVFDGNAVRDSGSKFERAFQLDEMTGIILGPNNHAGGRPTNGFDPQFTNGDTTPSVSTRAPLYRAGNTGATSITTFDDGQIGQVLHVRFTNGNTTLVNGATIKLAGAANFVGTTDDTITLIHDGSAWRELARSVN